MSSSRRLSTEALRPLSLSEGVMMNPFLNATAQGGHIKEKDFTDSIAYMELFKAISSLNSQPSTPTSSSSSPASTDTATTSTSADLSLLNADENNDVGEVDTSLHEEEKDNSLDFTGVAEMMAADADAIEEEKQGFICSLGQAMNRKRNLRGTHKTVMELFTEARSNPHNLLDSKGRERIFRFFLLGGDVVSAWEVLKHHQLSCKAEGSTHISLMFYQQLFECLFAVGLTYNNNNNPRHSRPPKNGQGKIMDAWKWREVVEDITEHIQKEYSKGEETVYQYLLLPSLVDSMTKKKDPFVHRCAKPIVEYIMDSQFPLLEPVLYEGVLERAVVNRVGPDFIPYHKVLSYLVSNGHKPKPENVINVLQSYHPFTDIEAVHEVLKTVQKLHPNDDATPSPGNDYRVDLGTLESISMLSARKNIDLNLLVWDLVELFGDRPTESMFEDVVMSFAATKQDVNLYSALVDMEKNWFVPSRALLKYVAIKVGYHDKRLHHSKKLLTWYENEHLRSTHTMNSLIMAYGMKRDLNSAFFVFEEMTRYQLQPDMNTFTFLMDALYIDTKDRFDFRGKKKENQANTDDVDNVVGAAQVILESMEEFSVPRSKSFTHEHVRVLCAVGKLDDAYAVLEEAVSTGTSVTGATMFLLANRFSELGEYERAHEVADLSEAAGCGDKSNLTNRINNIQRQSRTDGNAPRSW